MLVHSNIRLYLHMLGLLPFVAWGGALQLWSADAAPNLAIKPEPRRLNPIKG